MKKGLLQKILAGTLIASMTLSSVAFAADTTTKSLSVSYGGLATTLNGKEVPLKDASNKAIEMMTYNKVNYVPIYPIAKALGWTMTYDAKTKVVTLKGSTTSQTGTKATAATTASTTTAATGTPPTGTPPSGDPPTGTPPSGTPPTGEAPTGTPPSGTPPTGEAPTGTPPSGTPPTGNQPPTTTTTTTTSATTTTKATTIAANNAKITKTKAVTKKISAIYGQKYTVNGKTVALANTSTVTLVGFSYNGVVYLPVKAVEKIFSLKSSVDTKNSVIMFTGGTASQTTAATTTQSSVTGTAVYKVSSNVGTLTDKTYAATKANQSGVIVTKGGSLTLTNGKVKKTGDSTAVETSNFTGLNAGILVENGGQLTLNADTITTDAEGSNAVVSTGDGSKVTINGITIITNEDSARGLHATYNGTIIASDVNIYTKGAHSGAITTDRGEGIVTVNGGTVVTEGDGSPGIYSTGNITVSNLTSTATGSEAAVIEGKNSITLTDAILSGAKKWGVMIYQSFSGDAGTGTGTFTMTGGSLTAATGPLFYSTNTNGVINLKNVDLEQVSGILIQADGNNQWGTKGSNGANLVVTADTQILKGSIVADAISTVKLTLKNTSTLTGAINTDNTAKSIGLTLEETSIWNVTADSYLTTLVNADADLSNIVDNGHTVYYDSSQSANSWLEGKTLTLKGGGTLMPVSAK